MVLEQHKTQPFLQIEFLKIGFDWRKFKLYNLIKVSFVTFDDGKPVIKVADMKYYSGKMFDFHLPTEAYLALARTTLIKKVPIQIESQKKK